MALDPGAAEIIALGAGDRLVGIPAGSPPATGRQAPRSAADVSAKAGFARRGVELEPDLLVAHDDRPPRRHARKAAHRSCRSMSSPPLGERHRAGDPRARLPRRRAGQAGRSASGSGPRSRRFSRISGEPITTAFVDTGFFVTVPLHSLLGDLSCARAGESVAGETPGVDPFPVNQPLRLDPDVYLATSDSRVTKQSLQNDPRTAKLTAVENGRVRVLPSDLVQRAGPYVAEALERVARALHPDAFQADR